MSHLVAAKAFTSSAKRECISSVVFLCRYATTDELNFRRYTSFAPAWRPEKTTLEMYSLAAAFSRKNILGGIHI